MNKEKIYEHEYQKVYEAKGVYKLKPIARTGFLLSFSYKIRNTYFEFKIKENGGSIVLRAEIPFKEGMTRKGAETFANRQKSENAPKGTTFSIGENKTIYQNAFQIKNEDQVDKLHNEFVNFLLKYVADKYANEDTNLYPNQPLKKDNHDINNPNKTQKEPEKKDEIINEYKPVEAINRMSVKEPIADINADIPQDTNKYRPVSKNKTKAEEITEIENQPKDQEKKTEEHKGAEFVSEKTYEEINKLREDLKEKIDKKEETLTKRENSIIQKEDIITSKENELIIREKEVREKEAALLEDVNYYEAEKNRWETEVIKKESKLKAKESELNRVKREVDELKKKLLQKEDELNEAIMNGDVPEYAQIHEKLRTAEEKIILLKSSETTLRKQNVEITYSFDKEKNKTKELKEEIKEKNNTISELQEALDNLKLETGGKSKEQKEKYKKEMKELTKRIKDYDTEIEEYRTKIDDLRDEKEKLQEKIANTNEQNMQIQKEYTQILSKYNSLEALLAGRKDDNNLAEKIQRELKKKNISLAESMYEGKVILTGVANDCDITIYVSIGVLEASKSVKKINKYISSINKYNEGSLLSFFTIQGKKITMRYSYSNISRALNDVLIKMNDFE